jgi:hypothetical protein
MVVWQDPAGRFLKCPSFLEERDRDMSQDHLDEQIEELERRLETLKSQWPAHSLSPAMLQQLEDLEDELAQAQQARAERESQTGSPLH